MGTLQHCNVGVMVEHVVVEARRADLHEEADPGRANLLLDHFPANSRQPVSDFFQHPNKCQFNWLLQLFRFGLRRCIITENTEIGKSLYSDYTGWPGGTTGT